MAGGCWHGGRLDLLPLIREYEDAVEMDLAAIGIDYRDRWREGGGVSRLTTRRLLLLVDGLDRYESHFWSEVSDSDRVSAAVIVLTDIWSALAGGEKIHPLREMKKRMAAAKEREEKKRAIREASRLRKRMRRQD